MTGRGSINIIKQSVRTQHHDVITGDVLGQDRAQLVFWNQGACASYLARIPENARSYRTHQNAEVGHVK
jgi:hypothetical protein